MNIWSHVWPGLTCTGISTGIVWGFRWMQKINRVNAEIVHLKKRVEKLERQQRRVAP